MSCLLDTHAILWMVAGDDRLSQTCTEIILDHRNELYFSMASYWEICIKVSIDKLALSDDWPEVFDREKAHNGIQWLPIGKEHVQGLLDLPWYHMDPFDRLLIAQAVHEELIILTVNSGFMNTTWSAWRSRGERGERREERAKKSNPQKRPLASLLAGESDLPG